MTFSWQVTVCRIGSDAFAAAMKQAAVERCPQPPSQHVDHSNLLCSAPLCCVMLCTRIAGYNAFAAAVNSAAAELCHNGHRNNSTASICRAVSCHALLCRAVPCYDVPTAGYDAFAAATNNIAADRCPQPPSQHVNPQNLLCSALLCSAASCCALTLQVMTPLQQPSRNLLLSYVATTIATSQSLTVALLCSAASCCALILQVTMPLQQQSRKLLLSAAHNHHHNNCAVSCHALLFHAVPCYDVLIAGYNAFAAAINNIAAERCPQPLSRQVSPSNMLCSALLRHAVHSYCRLRRLCSSNQGSCY
jgi:hypothetical protein